MKMKSKTKKLLVLSVMVVLLVTTGVLNFVLSDKLASKTDTPSIGDLSVTQTFFASARSEREATRESEFLSLDAIVNSESSSASAKQTAEEQKLKLIERMEMELALETAIKARGYDDAIVTIGDGGITVVVDGEPLTDIECNKILYIVVTEAKCDANDVRVLNYA